MEKYSVRGGQRLKGSVKVSGAKNVALKTAVAACLTSEKVIIHNVPLLSDFTVMTQIIVEFGGTVTFDGHTVMVSLPEIKNTMISLDEASQTRTANMFMAPLLARTGQAVIPNPGGCRIGARPIDRTVEGLKLMGAEITYNSDDGFFHASITHADGKLHGVTYRFAKNTHTGTETMIIAGVLAKGQTILQNAAEEPEIDELIAMLNSMGAKIKRKENRVIEIEGVDSLHGITFTIGADRNEIVTFAVAAIATKGDVMVVGAKREGLLEFLEALDIVGGGYEVKSDGIRFFAKKEPLKPSYIETRQYPGFMTDWQAPWAILMTQAAGESTIHETVFESRFSYVPELQKMGAKITFFQPQVANPEAVYNFNAVDEKEEKKHAIRIFGPQKLHDAVVKMTDLRAGATLVIAALLANGTSTIHGIHFVRRGYEDFDKRLRALGADIKIVEDTV